MVIITVNGGKGGTGKTFVAVNLALYLANQHKKVLLVDSDVENPNSNILLGIPVIEEKENALFKQVYQFVPEIIEDRCAKCGLCSTNCRTHALFGLNDQVPILMENMCSGCKLCFKICPENAITSNEKLVGDTYFLKDLRKYESGFLDLLTGVLKVGEVRSVEVVESLLESSQELTSKYKYDFIIFDQSPGAHCDVEAAMKHSDYSISVTEPTPFGAHDLKRILELSRIIDKRAVIVLNRVGLADYYDEILQVTKEFGTQLIAEIPLDQKILESYARGIPFLEYPEIGEDNSSMKAFYKIGSYVIDLAENTNDNMSMGVKK